MYTVWVSPPTVLVISLGFAGLLGDQIRQLRTCLNHRQMAAALGLIGLVMLPPLSLPPAIQWFGWITASLVIVLFTFQPKKLPAVLFSRRFAWKYASLAMLLACIWNLLSGFAMPYLLLSALALFASLLTWVRSRNLAI